MIFNHLIFIRRLSAITPKGGLTTATISVAIATDKDHTASPVMVIDPRVVVRPLASRNKYAYQPGSKATVTLVSKADFPQS